MTAGPVNRPLILDIKGNSLDDGPGIRTVVFFKGCPLSCVWCHNPESKEAGEELSFDPEECVGCDTCLSVCGAGALDRKNPFLVDRAACTLCFKCADACPSGALARVGRYMPVEEVMAVIARDKPFYDTSGGGVTLSGGEPTLSMAYASSLLKSCKTQGIHTIVETCGEFSLDRFIEGPYPFLDTIYYDIKIFDDAAHRTYCGRGNGRILENFAALYRHSLDGGAGVFPRIPLIPDITDTPGNIGAIASFLKELGVQKAALLPYHPLWREKNHHIGVHNPLGEREALKQWQDPVRLARCVKILEEAGIEV